MRIDHAGAPLVSVITPTLNAAAFLAATLESVAAQELVNFEHVVVDGGSTDETHAIVQRFPHATWVDAPGSRQTVAMNRGAAVARGSLLVFLNADDILLPGAFLELAEAFAREPGLDVAYGEATQIGDDGGELARYPTADFDPAKLPEECFICQAGAMIRRSTFERFGGFSEDLDLSMDYDLWLRMAPTSRFRHVHREVARVRLHSTAKTVSRRDDVYQEAFTVLRRNGGYVPYSWVYAYADHLIQRDDQVFVPRRAQLRKVLLALVLGLWLNRRDPLRATRDWMGRRAPWVWPNGKRV